jgi:hypothetical protein
MNHDGISITSGVQGMSLPNSMKISHGAKKLHVMWSKSHYLIQEKTLKNSVLWDITPRSPLNGNQRFSGTCHLLLQGQRISQSASYWFPARCIFKF